MSFEIITKFEKEIAKFFGAPHAVAVDCCTHGLELCLRMKKIKKIKVPKHTYLSVPMLSDKLNLDIEWTDEKWQDYYYLAENIIDAAILWKPNSYVPNTYMNGRSPDFPWTQQNIKTMGYHYYMTPETAELGLKKLPEAIQRKPKQWVYTDWPDLTTMNFFKKKRE